MILASLLFNTFCILMTYYLFLLCHNIKSIAVQFWMIQTTFNNEWDQSSQSKQRHVSTWYLRNDQDYSGCFIHHLRHQYVHGYLFIARTWMTQYFPDWEQGQNHRKTGRARLSGGDTECFWWKMHSKPWKPLHNAIEETDWLPTAECWTDATAISREDTQNGMTMNLALYFQVRLAKEDNSLQPSYPLSLPWWMNTGIKDPRGNAGETSSSMSSRLPTIALHPFIFYYSHVYHWYYLPNDLSSEHWHWFMAAYYTYLLFGIQNHTTLHL